MNVFSLLFRRSDKSRTYSDLMQLDEHLLRDIGLTRTDVRQMMHGVRTANPRKDRRS
jgi:uncharacterized protein YjiS (DUF1127 family)